MEYGHLTLEERTVIMICMREGRGLNENTDGLLRQYFPKGCTLVRVTEEDLQRVECLLNNRPGKCLGYRTPAEALQQELRALDV